MGTILEFRETNVPPKTITPKGTITTLGGLFIWLWSRLDHLKPRIAVDEILVRAKNELFDFLNEEKFIAFPPVYYADILSLIRWTEQANPTAHRCGMELLNFIGSFGEAIAKNDGARIPKERAIEMMLGCWKDWANYLEFHRTPTRGWVETPPLGIETFGVSICVELFSNGDFLYDDLFDLSVPFE